MLGNLWFLHGLNEEGWVVSNTHRDRIRHSPTPLASSYEIGFCFTKRFWHVPSNYRGRETGDMESLVILSRWGESEKVTLFRTSQIKDLLVS
jgi:hypothetical protein